MHIRNIIEKDLSQLAELYYQFWGDKSDIDKMKQQLKLMQEENHHIILVCEDDETIIGSVMGIVCRELYGDCRPFLVVENMIVDKEHRKQGVGTMLLKELENKAKERDCTQMILVTEKDRIDACGFYESFGFSRNTTGYKKKINQTVIEVYHRIAIVGANGSGKTTLGRELAKRLGYKHMDIEDYCFEPSEIPYSKARSKEDETYYLLQDMKIYPNFIFTTANCDYGEPINSFYDLIIYLKAPLDIRLNRVKQRAFDKHGERVLPGGDMYEQEQNFFDYVATRTMDKTDAFVNSVSCRVIYIDSSQPLSSYVDDLVNQIKNS